MIVVKNSFEAEFVVVLVMLLLCGFCAAYLFRMVYLLRKKKGDEEGEYGNTNEDSTNNEEINMVQSLMTVPAGAQRTYKINELLHLLSKRLNR